MKTPAFFDRSPLTQALWTFRREFLLAGLFSAVVNVLMLTPTIYMLQIYDRVLVGLSELTLLAVSMICLFLFAVIAFSDWIRSRILVRAGVRLDEALGTRVFNSSFEAYLDSAGINPQRAFSDLLQVRQFLTGQGIFAFFDAPWAPIYIAVMFVLHPLLGLASIAFGCVQIALAWFGHRRTVAPAEAVVRADTEVKLYVQGKLRNAEVLEAMGMVGHLRRRWRQRQAGYHEKSMTSQRIDSTVQGASKFARYSQQSLTLGVGALLVIQGELSPSAMIAANVLMSRALAPIDALVNSWRAFFTAKAAFERLEALLARYPQRNPSATGVALTGEVTLRQVVASASGRPAPILKNISFSVPAGTVVVVLGPSGSGKSTLARAMLGIWPDVSGEVMLDGLPLQSWSRDELGPRLGYLPQDVELFEGTIAENIARFGELDSQKVIAAATSAGLHQIILRFPSGYDTPIGQGGEMLSGGLRQRIALARAIYGDPTLVVLDEPNANLDEAGEAALTRCVAELKAAGTTVFLITHRPQAISASDWVMLLRDGELVASGPRDVVIGPPNPQAARPSDAGPALAPQPV